VNKQLIILYVVSLPSFNKLYAKFVPIYAISVGENDIYVHNDNSLSLYHTARSILHPSSDGTSSEWVNIHHYLDLESQTTRIPDFSG
jgi:hypothetical protein